MSAAQDKAQEALSETILFIEELTANEAKDIALKGFSVVRTVAQLKRRIANSIGQPRDWNSVQVIYAGEALDDQAPPPYEVKTTDDVAAIKTLFFRDFDGKTMTLKDLPLDMTLEAVFNKLAEEKHIDVTWLRFLWSGKQLEGGRTIHEYGIQNESTIHIVARLHGGRV